MIGGCWQEGCNYCEARIPRRSVAEKIIRLPLSAISPSPLFVSLSRSLSLSPSLSLSRSLSLSPSLPLSL